MDPFAVFQSLGPVRLYRSPEKIDNRWAEVEGARAELRRRFESCVSDGERLRMATDVTRRLLAIARRRASACQLQHDDLVCENLDIETILADWVEFVGDHVQASGDAPHAV